MSENFKALRAYEKQDGRYTQSIENKSFNDLPDNNTLIKVHYSSLNYKDALSAIGNKGVTKNYPHTPGIDAAGEIVETTSEEFNKGDEVIVSGFDLGMDTWGGFSQYIRVPDTWLIQKPERMSMKQAMSIGTAGLTAGLAASELFLNDIKDNGTILVTGATGGLGSIALTILSRYDYKLVGVTGSEKSNGLLEKLGVDKVMSREELKEKPEKPLLKGEFAGAIDVAGGDILASILKRMDYNGTVISCGLVDSPQLQTTVFPFILRGVRLIGIDSQDCEINYRKKIWYMFAHEWKFEFLDEMLTEISLEEVPQYIPKILHGDITGRIVVRVE
jgi:putative YhdH/YhfP family quinone oxidoreductase